MLSMMGRCEALPVLCQGMHAADAHTRWEAVSAAGALRHSQMAAPVAKLLSPRQPLALRQEAVLALGRIGGGRARTALARALDDPEPGVRWRASMALAGNGADASPLLRKRLERETDSKVIDQLTQDLARWEVRYGRSERRAGA
jgi:HEAT repeat protein